MGWESSSAAVVAVVVAVAKKTSKSVVVANGVLFITIHMDPYGPIWTHMDHGPTWANGPGPMWSFAVRRRPCATLCPRRVVGHKVEGHKVMGQGQGHKVRSQWILHPPALRGPCFAGPCVLLGEPWASWVGGSPLIPSGLIFQKLAGEILYGGAQGAAQGFSAFSSLG